MATAEQLLQVCGDAVTWLQRRELQTQQQQQQDTSAVSAEFSQRKAAAEREVRECRNRHGR